MDVFQNWLASIVVVPIPRTSHSIIKNITILLDTNYLPLHETYETPNSKVEEIALQCLTNGMDK